MRCAQSKKRPTVPVIDCARYGRWCHRGRDTGAGRAARAHLPRNSRHAGAPSYELRERQCRAAFERETEWFCYVAEAADRQLVGFAKGTLYDGGVPFAVHSYSIHFQLSGALASLRTIRARSVPHGRPSDLANAYGQTPGRSGGASQRCPVSGRAKGLCPPLRQK